MKATLILAILFFVCSAAIAQPARLVNLSCLAGVIGGRSVIVGFVITGTQPRQMLVRAIGPGLRDFGVTDTLADPRIDLGGIIYDDWYPSRSPAEVAAIGRTGAFALPSSSLDSVALITARPGSFTPLVKNIGRDFGRVLLEVYDADSNSATSPALVNIAVRNQVDSQGNSLVVGFVIAGDGETGILMRVLGPALNGLIGTNHLEDPDLVVHRNGQQIYYNDDFAMQANGANILTISESVGAFQIVRDPKLHTGKDAAAFLRLPSGNYTITVKPRAPDRESRYGEVLAEIYVVR